MPIQTVIYLDNAATTKPSSRVIREMVKFLELHWYNPSSGYLPSRGVKNAIDDARASVAELIDAKPEEVIFTSGGTESNNTALFSADALLPKDVSIATTRVEHSAVLRPIEQISASGRCIEYLEVNEAGRVTLPKEFSPGLLSMMWANNETGIIQPIQEAVELCKRHNVAFHTDAVQVVGKQRVSVQDTPVDMLSISGHKLNGPKGVGALYVRSGCRMAPYLYGGGQEAGMRSGTENVAGIIGLGVAAADALSKINNAVFKDVGAVREAFETRVLETVRGAEVNGDRAHRLPTHSHISFDGCEAEGLVILLDEYGVLCSSGSACMTGKQQPSHVQVAMGFSEQRAKSSLRFSFSHENTMEEALLAAQLVKKAVDKLRSVQSSGTGPVVIYTP